jgi:hypothetical protein
MTIFCLVCKEEKEEEKVISLKKTRECQSDVVVQTVFNEQVAQTTFRLFFAMVFAKEIFFEHLNK